MTTLSDLLHSEPAFVSLPTTSRIVAIGLLAQALDLARYPSDGSETKDAVVASKAAEIYYVGNGIAILHARSACATNIRLAIGRAAERIEIHCADGKPICLVFYLAVPTVGASPDKILAALSYLAKDQALSSSLLRASSVAEAWNLIARAPI